MLEATYTIAEVADSLRCSTRKVSDVACAHGIGMNLKGRAGWRFTEADVAALRDALRVQAPVVVRRKRRR